MSSPTEELFAALQQLPDDVNPYYFALDELQHLIIPETPQFFVPTLYVLIGLAVVGLLLGVVTLVSKACYSALWIVRIRHTPMGRVLTTNTTAVLAILNCIHFAAAIAAEALMVRTFSSGKSPVPWHSLQTFLWLPVALSSWTETAGTALASFLSSAGRDSHTSSMSKRMPKVKKGPLKAWQINMLTGAGYVVVPIACIPLFGMSAAKYDVAWHHFQDIRAAALPAAERWQPGSGVPVEVLSELQQMVSDFAQAGGSAMDLIGKAFIALIALLLAAGIVYIPSACIYIKMLHRQLHSYVNSSTGASSAAAEERHRKTRVVNLRNTVSPSSPVRTTHLMIAESVIVLLLNVCFLATGITVGFKPRMIIESGKNIAIFFTVCFAAYGITGTILNAILCFRSIQPLLARSKGPKTLADAIAVETVVERFLDGEDDAASENNDGSQKVEMERAVQRSVLSFDGASSLDELKEQKVERFSFGAPPSPTKQPRAI